MDTAVRRAEWTPSNLAGGWQTSRLELEVVASNDKHTLSGQTKETAAREMLCLEYQVPPDASSRGDALGRLHEHVKRLYAPTEGPGSGGLPPLVSRAGGSLKSRRPALPRHPALPALFAVSPLSEPDEDGPLAM